MSEAPVSPNPPAAPHAAILPQDYTNIDFRKVGKALQLVTDRTKPLLVPVLCKVWDHVPADTMSKIVKATTWEEAEAAIKESTFPISIEVTEFLRATISLRLSL